MTGMGERTSVVRVAEGGQEAAVALGAIPSGRLEFASGAAHLRIGVDPSRVPLMPRTSRWRR